MFVFILQQAWGLVISNRGEGEGHKSVHDGGDGGSLAANYLAAPCRRRWSHHCVAAETSLHGDGGNVHQKKTTTTIYNREDSGLLWRIFVCALGYRSFVYFMRKEIFGTDSSHLDNVNNYLLPNSNSLQSTFLLLVAHSFERETTVLLRGKQALASSVWENNKVGDIDSSIPPQICVFFFQTTSSAHSPPAVALTTSSGFLEF